MQKSLSFRRNRTGASFFFVSLILFLVRGGWSQPLDEPRTPQEVVWAFLTRSEAQEWNRLAELCTFESQKLMDPYQGGQMPFLIPLLLLLQATPEQAVQIGAWQVEGEIALVPLHKELELEFRVALRREGPQWKIHLPATHLIPPVYAPAEGTGNVVEQFVACIQAGRWQDAGPLFVAASRPGLLLEEMARLEQVRDGALLAWAPLGMETDLRLENETADEASVGLHKTASLEQTLILRQEEGEWRIDFLASSLVSGGTPTDQLLRQIRDKAKQAACRGHLKQLGRAMLQYAQDHGGALPSAETWTQALQPYLDDEGVFRCPAVPELVCGYAMNTACSGARLDDLEEPEETVLLFDSTQGQLQAHDRGESLPRPGRHRGGNHLVGADGQVQWVWWEQARQRLGWEEESKGELPDPNGFDDYVTAGKLVVEKEEALADEAADATLETAVQENAAALEKLREGLAKECRCPPVRSFSTPLPHLGDFRKLARILQIEGRLAERRGNYPAAVESYLDMAHLGQDVTRGGVLVHHLVGIAIETSAQKELSEILEELHEKACEKLLRGMSTLVETTWPYAATLAQEYRMCQGTLLEMMTGENAGALLPQEQFLPVGVDMATTLMHLERFYDQIVSTAQQPYYEREAMDIPQDPLLQPLIPGLKRTGWQVALAEARRNLIQAAVALHLYRLQHGDYPDGWEALTPDYLAEAPADPFRAAPLVYRRVDEGYQLYSVGPNGEDDGGAARTGPELEADPDGDLVWGELF